MEDPAHDSNTAATAMQPKGQFIAKSSRELFGLCLIDLCMV